MEEDSSEEELMSEEESGQQFDPFNPMQVSTQEVEVKVPVKRMMTFQEEESLDHSGIMSSGVHSTAESAEELLMLCLKLLMVEQKKSRLIPKMARSR